MDSKSFSLMKFAVILLVIFILLLIASSPLVSHQLTPYKTVDESYIDNPNYNEKVQFEATYMGITSWADDNINYYMPPIEYDVLKVGSHYIVLEDDYSNHNLYGNESCHVHLEGVFNTTEVTFQPFNDTMIEAHVFSAEKIEVQ